MRKLNILTEDYIQLESNYANIEKETNHNLTSLREAIDEEVSKYLKSERDNAAYLTLRYSPIVEQLVRADYRTGLARLSMNLSRNNSIPLSEAAKLSFAIKENEAAKYVNDIPDALSCFGELTECDVPQSNGNYVVTYTSTGKTNAIRNIAALQESVINSFDKLKSTKPNELHDALYSLANVYSII